MRRILVLISLLASLAPAQQVQVQAQLGSRTAVLGEALDFAVEVVERVELGSGRDPREAPRPRLPESQNYEVSFVRSSTSQGQSMTIFNGRRSGHVDYTTTFLFKITPKSTGRVVIPSWEYEFGDKTHRIAGRSIIVEREAPGNRYASVIVVTDNDRPFVNQPVRIRYRFDSEKRILSRDRRGQQPEVDIPWAEVPNGAWAVPFDELDGATPKRGQLVVALNGKPFGLKTIQRRGTENESLEFERVIYPLAQGRLELGGTSTRLSLATRLQRGQFGGVEVAETARVVLNSEPLVLEVRDAPLAGRPASYTGVIGDFTGSARLSDGKIRAGDGVTLTLELEGTGALESLAAPELTAFDAFDVYEPDKRVEGDGARRKVIFSWLLVPRSTDVTEVPRFEFSWFRPSTETFEVAAAGPVPLEISGEVETGDIFESTITARRAAEIRTLGEGVRPLKESPGDLSARKGPGAALFLAMALLPLLSLVATRIALGRRRRLAGDEGLVRRRGASKAATARLDEARSLLGGERGFHGKLARCLSGFIGDKIGVPAASVSAATVRSLLESAGAKTELVDAAAQVLEELDMKEFGGGEGDEAARRADLARVEGLIGHLDKVLRS